MVGQLVDGLAERWDVEKVSRWDIVMASMLAVGWVSKMDAKWVVWWEHEMGTMKEHQWEAYWVEQLDLFQIIPTKNTKN